MSTPKSTYETTEGTEPTPYGVHDPRTVARTVTTGDNSDLFLMTEIGDGVFVQWTHCRRCSKRVAGCSCPEGPKEPPYMAPWREKRFKYSMNERPEPPYELLDTVIGWVRERGYTVTKKGKKEVEDQTAVESEPLARPSTVFERPADGVYEVPEESLDDEGVSPEKVDEGLDAALTKVREARDDIDPGF